MDHEWKPSDDVADHLSFVEKSKLNAEGVQNRFLADEDQSEPS
jgi:hypothetical protein